MQYNLLLDQHRNMQSSVGILQRRVLELEQSLQLARTATPTQMPTQNMFAWPQPPPYMSGPQMFGVLFLMFIVSLPFDSDSTYIPTLSRELLSIEKAASTVFTFAMRSVLAVVLLLLISFASNVVAYTRTTSKSSNATSPGNQQKILKLVQKALKFRSSDTAKSCSYAERALKLLGKPTASTPSTEGSTIRQLSALIFLAREVLNLSRSSKALVDLEMAMAELHCHIIVMERNSRAGNRDISAHIAALNLLTAVYPRILADPHSSFATLAGGAYQFIWFSLSNNASLLSRRLSSHAQKRCLQIRQFASSTENLATDQIDSQTPPSPLEKDELSASLSGLATDFIGRSIQLLSGKGHITFARDEIVKFLAILESDKSESAAAAVTFWKPKLSSSLVAYDMLLDRWGQCLNASIRLLLWFRESPALRDAEAELLVATLGMTALLKLKRPEEAQKLMNAVMITYSSSFVAHAYSLVSMRRIEAWLQSFAFQYAKAIYLLEESLASLEKNVHSPHLTMEPLWFASICFRVTKSLVHKWTQSPHSCSSTDGVILMKALEIADKCFSLLSNVTPAAPYLKPRVLLLKAKFGIKMTRLIELMKNQDNVGVLLKQSRGHAESYSSITRQSLDEAIHLCQEMGSDYDKYASKISKRRANFEAVV